MKSSGINNKHRKFTFLYWWNDTPLDYKLSRLNLYLKFMLKEIHIIFWHLGILLVLDEETADRDREMEMEEQFVRICSAAH